MKQKFKKIASLLDEKYGVDKRKTLMEGVEIIFRDNPKSTENWMRQFINKLNNESDCDLKTIFGDYCPCKIQRDTIEKAKKILASSSSIRDFVITMNEKRVIGKKIRYDEDNHIIYITKLYACDCGGGYDKGNSVIAQRCHCDLVYATEEYITMDYCYCAGKFYEPLFKELFGSNVMIKPVKTVLTGHQECIFAIQLLM
ncbi:hypothetical protein [Vallitalea okinawensis]|uniref:hypothetical protein n=1 Tax=Vallitalea okinawensis TaxID=2078660 RepID=UPI000CFC5945|nr:hypothetical protein [Vallitalea okinawensis]